MLHYSHETHALSYLSLSVPKLKCITYHTNKPDSGKLGVRLYHKPRLIEILFRVVGGLPTLVKYFTFYQNRSSGFGEIWLPSVL